MRALYDERRTIRRDSAQYPPSLPFLQLPPVDLPLKRQRCIYVRKIQTTVLT
jgi:hypothetical protein